ncbi:MAG TPA: hypothetical protein PLN52_21765 [Opitutaceae bacterium]|nr:hypothetical protein [Opitutaceae bacterium]
MRPLVIILLALSLAGNVAWVIHRVGKSEATALSEKENSERAGTDEAQRDAVTEKRSHRSAGEFDGPRTGVVWREPSAGESLTSSDLKSLVRRLQEAGFPRHVIRAVVYAEVNERFAARQAALRQQGNQDVYWSNPRRMLMDTSQVAANRALNLERSQLVKEVLGDLGPDDNPLAESFRRRQYGDLDGDKVQQLEQVLNDYNELRSEIYASAQGMLLPEDQEKLAYLEREQRADIEQLLTPKEREEYALRSSALANQIRSRFQGFEATEDEYRAIYAAVRAAGLGESMTGGPTSPEAARAQEAQVAAAIQATLSPERLAEFQRGSDPRYAAALRLTSRLNLPATAASELLGIQSQALERATQLQADPQLTPEQKAAQLQLITSQTEQQISQALGGNRGLEAYRLYGGQWLNSLKVPTPRPR